MFTPSDCNCYRRHALPLRNQVQGVGIGVADGVVLGLGKRPDVRFEINPVVGVVAGQRHEAGRLSPQPILQGIIDRIGA